MYWKFLVLCDQQELKKWIKMPVKLELSLHCKTLINCLEMPKHHQDKGSVLKWIYNILLRAVKDFSGNLFLCIVGEQIQILNV